MWNTVKMFALGFIAGAIVQNRFDVFGKAKSFIEEHITSAKEGDSEEVLDETTE